MNNSNEVNWDPAVWQGINEAVMMEVAKVRIAQKVFPTMTYDDVIPTEVQNDAIDFSDLSILEGQTKPFVEVYQEFPLTNAQVSKEAQLMTCKTLARMAAKAIALAEDIIIFQGQSGKLPANVQADLVASTADGLLGAANPKDANNNDPLKVTKPIDIPKQQNPKPGVKWGENIFSAVAEGRAQLTRKAQAPMYALILPTEAYADTFVPPSDASLVTTAERIEPLVEGGFHGTGTLPPDKGLLVALAGEPTSLYLGREATTEFVRKEGSKYFFRVVERIQFVVRDPRALVQLNFK
jgi:uncharacterized linocin/CFP29 family protein